MAMQGDEQLREDEKEWELWYEGIVLPHLWLPLKELFLLYFARAWRTRMN